MKKRKSKKQLKEQALLYNLGHQIKQLEAHKLGLKQQQEHLESEQQSLVVKQAALAACCDLLHWLRTGQVDKGWRVSRNKWGLPGELPLLQDLLGLQADSSIPLTSVLKELTARELQQQQGASGGGSSASSRDGAGAAAAPAATNGSQVQDSQQQSQQQQQPFSVSEPLYLSPDPGDYSGLLRYTFSQPPYPGAQDMNLQQFGEYYCAYVQKCALNLAQAEAQVPQLLLAPHQASNGQDCQQHQQQRCQDSQPCSGSTDEQQQQQWACGGSSHPLLELRQLTLQHVRLIMSLSMLHQGDLLQRIRASQWLTPQVAGDSSTLQVADNGEQAWQRLHWVVDRLQLRADQKHSIIAGSSLFKHLVGQILSERQALLAQQGEQAGMRLPTGRAVDLQQQEQSTKRLQVLVRKELFLATCASAFTVGVLDVVQLAKSMVLMWPLVPQMMQIGPVLIEKAVAAAAAEQQQQQAGQQQQQQQQAGQQAQEHSTPC